MIIEIYPLPFRKISFQVKANRNISFFVFNFTTLNYSFVRVNRYDSSAENKDPKR